MNIGRTKMIIYSLAAAVGLAVFLVLLLTGDMGLWLFWILGGIVAGVLSMLLSYVVVGYIAAGKDDAE